MKWSHVFISALVVLCLAAAPSQAQRRIWVSPDVPTDPDGPVTYLPWQIVEHETPGPAPFALELTVPGDPAVDAIEKMDLADNWLFSVEAPSELAGALGGLTAEPRDVIRLNAGIYSHFFDASCVSGIVPTTSNVDAVYLESGDAGAIVVSFDVPTTIGSVTFQPGELVRYRRSGIGACGWTLSTTVLDASAVGTYFPASTNVIGADRAGDDWILALDVPVDLAPPAGPTRTPGQIVSTDGATWDHFFVDLQAAGAPGWPLSSLVDALACQSNPGKIDSPTDVIRMDKSLPSIEIVCPGSCSSGAEEYGLYEGTIANVSAGTYDHKKKGCQRSCPSTFSFLPASGDTYYLLVPSNLKLEGSYGVDSSNLPRPQPVLVADRCLEDRFITACP